MKVVTLSDALPQLYEDDETAWLEVMSRLVAEGRYEEMDHDHLSKYLADMARRDRREVFSRLVTLLTHLLKWEGQPENRSRSWLGTMVEQRRELRKLLESGTLLNHAKAVLAEAYEDARMQAAAETGLQKDQIAKDCPWDVEKLVSEEQ